MNKRVLLLCISILSSFYILGCANGVEFASPVSANLEKGLDAGNISEGEEDNLGVDDDNSQNSVEMPVVQTPTEMMPPVSMPGSNGNMPSVNMPTPSVNMPPPSMNMPMPSVSMPMPSISVPMPTTVPPDMTSRPPMPSVPMPTPSMPMVNKGPELPCRPWKQEDAASAMAADVSLEKVFDDIVLNEAGRVELRNIHAQITIKKALEIVSVQQVIQKGNEPKGLVKLSAPLARNLENIHMNLNLNGQEVHEVSNIHGKVCIGFEFQRSLQNIHGDVVLIGPANKRAVIKNLENIHGKVTLINVDVESAFNIHGDIQLKNSNIERGSNIKGNISNMP